MVHIIMLDKQNVLGVLIFQKEGLPGRLLNYSQRIIVSDILKMTQEIIMGCLKHVRLIIGTMRKLKTPLKIRHSQSAIRIVVALSQCATMWHMVVKLFRLAQQLLQCTITYVRTTRNDLRKYPSAKC